MPVGRGAIADGAVYQECDRGGEVEVVVLQSRLAALPIADSAEGEPAEM